MQRRGGEREEHAGREPAHGGHRHPPDGEVGVRVAQRAVDADEREAADEQRQATGDGGDGPVAVLDGRRGPRAPARPRRRARRVPADRRPPAGEPARRRRGPRAVRRPRSCAGLYHGRARPRLRATRGEPRRP